MSEEKVIELSEEILQFLLEYKTKQPGLHFGYETKILFNHHHNACKRDTGFKETKSIYFYPFIKRATKIITHAQLAL